MILRRQYKGLNNEKRDNRDQTVSKMRLTLGKGFRPHLWTHPNVTIYLNSVKSNNLRPVIFIMNNQCSYVPCYS